MMEGGWSEEFGERRKAGYMGKRVILESIQGEQDIGDVARLFLTSLSKTLKREKLQ